MSDDWHIQILIWGSLWNSRHPDPRRVWKGGSEQHFMPPLRRDPRANSKKLFFEDSFVNLTHFSVKDVPFSIKLTLWPKGSPKRAQGNPRSAQGRPKRIQRQPKCSQKSQNGAQSWSRGRQRRPKDTPRKPKGKIYIKKLPINRPSGRYVIFYAAGLNVVGIWLPESILMCFCIWNIAEIRLQGLMLIFLCMRVEYCWNISPGIDFKLF